MALSVKRNIPFILELHNFNGFHMFVKDIMTREPVLIDVREATISEAMEKMRGVDVHQVPAVNGRKYVGMLNYREIMRRRSLQLSSKAQNYVISTPELTPDTEITEVIQLLVDTGLSAFPVLEKKKLSGIVSRSDIIRHLEEVLGGQEIRNRQIMSTDPVSVYEEDSVDEAAVKMRGLDETEIPVLDPSGKLSGILRLDDIAADTFKRKKQKIQGREGANGDRAGDKIKVVIKSSSLMDNAEWVFPEDSIIAAAKIMSLRRLHVVPVVDHEMHLQGIVGVSDIIDSVDQREKEGILVIVSGVEPDERDIYDITYSMASKFLQRVSRMTGIKHGKFNIHVAKYRSEGKVKYSIRTKIIAEPLNMNVDYHHWNYGKGLSSIFDAYEERLKKWKVKGGREFP